MDAVDNFEATDDHGGRCGAHQRRIAGEAFRRRSERRLVGLRIALRNLAHRVGIALSHVEVCFACK